MNTFNYLKNLENQGFFVFGEPKIVTYFQFSRLRYKIFLTQEDNGVNFVISQGVLGDEEELFDVFFIVEPAYTASLFSCADFIKKYPTQDVFPDITYENLPNLKSEFVNTFGLNSSESKSLTFYIVSSILKEDRLVSSKNDSPEGFFNFEFYNEKVLQVADFLRKNYIAIGKPEQLAHLSRLTYLDEQERKELLQLPYKYLQKAFKPIKPYGWVNVPKLDSDYSKNSEIRVLELVP